MTLSHSLKGAFAALLLTLLAACGGGGGGGGASPPTLGGVAAVGSPIAGGAISIICASGSALATTTSSSGAGGAWQVTLSNQTLPCAVEVNGGSLGTYHSIATTGTANITPLTDLVVANLFGTANTTGWFAGLSASSGVPATVLGNVTSSQVAAAINNVTAILGFSPIGKVNPITTAFVPAAGDVSDDMLAALAAAMSASSVQFSSLLSAAASNVPAGVNMAAAFGNTKTGGAGLQSITVTPASPGKPAGTSQQFTATGNYSDGTSIDLTSSVTWSSSNTAVANFINPASPGYVTAVVVGNSASVPATITATLGTGTGAVSGSATLTVTPAALSSISIAPANPSYPLGLVPQFTAWGNYTDGTSHDITTNAAWSSDNASVATISATSSASPIPVTLVAPGTAHISANFGGMSGTTTLTVSSAALQSIVVTPASSSVAAGFTVQYAATGNYSDGTSPNITSIVNWTSGDTQVAQVSRSGLATGVATGNTSIFASYGTGGAAVSGVASLAVTPAILESIAVSPASSSVPVGLTLPFTATGTYSDRSTSDITTQVVWKSGSPSIATINASGVAAGVTQGSTAITATNGAVVSPSATLTVTKAVLETIAVTPASATVDAGLGITQQFTATGKYSDNSTQNITNSVTWNSDSSAANITPAGLATGLAAGSANITATSGGITSPQAILTVSPLQSIAVTPAAATVYVGGTQQFTATGTYANNSQQNITGNVTWASGSNAIATVNSAGLATGVGGGSIGITAASGSITSPAATLSVAVLQSINVTSAYPDIVVGSAQQFTATGVYSDSSTQNITGSVSWSSSSPAAATIGASSGLATGVAVGSTNITATLGSVSNSMNNVSVIQNTLPVTVDSGPAGTSNVNVPYVTVTVCSPGTTTCQTIDHIILDTGSSGLRLASDAVDTSGNPVKPLLDSLTAETDGSGNTLAECLQYAIGSNWGSVRLADVQLTTTAKASSVPIHYLGDPAMPAAGPSGSSCATASNLMDTVSNFGANGLMGVSVFLQDCGPACTSFATMPSTVDYYGCPGGVCSIVTVSLSRQVTNPVSLLPTAYNNGVTLQMQSLSSATGAATASGTLGLGVGTASNNQLGSTVKTYDLDQYGNFTTLFTGTYGYYSYAIPAFLDSGSNGLFFDSRHISSCGNGFYCPSSTLSLSAKNSGASNGVSATVPFTVYNANTLFSGNNTAFYDLAGGAALGGYFDWGLSFFYGKTVYETFQNSNGTGGFVGY